MLARSAVQNLPFSMTKVSKDWRSRVKTTPSARAVSDTGKGPPSRRGRKPKKCPLVRMKTWSHGRPRVAWTHATILRRRWRRFRRSPPRKTGRSPCAHPAARTPEETTADPHPPREASARSAFEGSVHPLSSARSPIMMDSATRRSGIQSEWNAGSPSRSTGEKPLRTRGTRSPRAHCAAFRQPPG